jgi:hypothetical protein
MQSHVQSEERAPGVVWMAPALCAPRDLGFALAAPGSRPGAPQARIANHIYLRTRRALSPLGCTMLSRNPQRLPVFPHFFGLY